MRYFAIALVLAVGCSPAPPRRPDPPRDLDATVTLRRNIVPVSPLLRDPERRYPHGPGALCSWDRDRYLHFFSETAEFCDVVFLDSSARVIEIQQLAGMSETGLTSESEVRHALFLSAGAVKKDGLQVGDKVAFSATIADAKPAPMPVIKVGGHEIHVEISNTIAQRMRGLMHRPRLSRDDGMLFCYPAEDERGYWMKNTLIALDIAYFAEDGRLINVARMKPHADPSQGGELKAPSAGPARFVLEVNYGWFDARKLIDADGRPNQPVKLEIPDSVRKLADSAE